MRKYHAIIVACLLCSSFAHAQPGLANFVDTGIAPQVFAPGVISTPFAEWSTSFTPDGQSVYSSQGAIYWTIVYSKKRNGEWLKPQVVSFSGKFRDTDPFVTPDGKKIFFISSRPQENASQDKPQAAMHIWYADRQSNDDWGIPHHLDSSININGLGNFAPSVSGKGTLYFCSRDRQGNAGMQSYEATWLGDHYDKPRLISVPGVTEIQDPFIAPDERYLVFLSGNDIYISLKQNNAWTMAQKLGPNVNNGDGNSSPCVSPDGKMLYYSSNRIQGFYKRDLKKAVDYDGLVKENAGLFNSQGNILMIPIHIPRAQG